MFTTTTAFYAKITALVTVGFITVQDNPGVFISGLFLGVIISYLLNILSSRLL